MGESNNQDIRQLEDYFVWSEEAASSSLVILTIFKCGKTDMTKTETPTYDHVRMCPMMTSNYCGIGYFTFKSAEEFKRWAISEYLATDSIVIHNLDELLDATIEYSLWMHRSYMINIIEYMPLSQSLYGNPFVGTNPWGDDPRLGT